MANGSFGWHAGEALLWVVFPAFLVVGCLILARRPGNVIGWIFTAVGLLTAAADLAESYAKYAYDHPGSLPVPLVAVWVSAKIWSPTIVVMVVFPLLLLPTGRSLSPRWRPVSWLAVGLTAAYTVSSALSPSLQLPNGRTTANPIGVAGMDLDHGLFGAVVNGLLLLVLAAAILSLVVRFCLSRGVERQQLKWFAYAGALVLVAPLSNALIGNVSSVLVLALPVAVGVAVLRYRLYDIDRLINRTLVYGLLTALLALVYAGLVLVLGQLFGGIGTEPPSWAVARPTVRHATRSNSETADREVWTASHAQASSKPRVNQAPGRAHGIAATITPCPPQQTLGASVSRNAWITPRSSARQRRRPSPWS